MSYLTQSTIAGDRLMNERVAQAAASEGEASPDNWAAANRRIWASAPGWDAAWESAIVSNPDPDYEPGADPGVITDQMILSQIQAMRMS